MPSLSANGAELYYERYLPDEETLSAPLYLIVSEDSRPVFTEIARRLGHLGVDVAISAGGHAAQHDHAEDVADLLRPIFRRVGGSVAENESENQPARRRADHPDGIRARSDLIAAR